MVNPDNPGEAWPDQENVGWKEVIEDVDLPSDNEESEDANVTEDINADPSHMQEQLGAMSHRSHPKDEEKGI